MALAKRKNESQAERWSTEDVQKKLNTNHSMEVIQKALDEFGGVTSDDDLAIFKSMLPTENAAALATVKGSNQIDIPSANIPKARPDANIKYVSQRTFAAKERAAEVAFDELQAIEEYSSTLQYYRSLNQEVELNYALAEAGLSTEGEYEERLERWNNHYAQQEQELAARQERLDQILASCSNIAAKAGVKWAS